VAQSLDFLRVLVERMPFDQDEQLPQASILVVDDELMSRLAITHALEKAHLRALSVEDAALALRLLEENPFDLVVADVDMPGMTGIQLCEKLRERPASKHTPVVFVSRLDDFQTQAKARLSGGNDYITKPFLPIELAVKALIHIMRGQLPQEKKAAA